MKILCIFYQVATAHEKRVNSQYFHIKNHLNIANSNMLHIIFKYLSEETTTKFKISLCTVGTSNYVPSNSAEDLKFMKIVNIAAGAYLNIHLF